MTNGKWLLVTTTALAAAGCGSFGEAADNIRWTTPHDATVQKKEITEAIGAARGALHDDHEKLLAGDKEGLAKSGERASAEEKARLAAIDDELVRQAKSWDELRSGVRDFAGNLIPGGVGAILRNVLSGVNQSANDTAAVAKGADAKATAAGDSADRAAAAAADAASEAKRAAAASAEIYRRLDALEDRLKKLDAPTQEALAKMRSELEASTLEKLMSFKRSELSDLEALKADRPKFDAELAKILAEKGVTQAEIDKIREETKGLSSEQILALLCVLAGGAAGGTAGGRALSRSGKRLDENQKQVDELFDEISALKVQIAKCCPKTPSD